jgi:membrane protein YqaA with SNARE-associated domain
MKFLDRLGQNLMLLGMPGLFLIAFIDSAAVPMVGGPDAVLLLLAWHKPHLFWLSALVAAVGSTLGCMVLYRIGRAGGDLALARFSEQKRNWVKQKLDQNAFAAVFAAVIAPPPFPTKLVILAAGACRMRLPALAAGVFAGRAVRYGLEAWLGARYGNDAAAIIRQHYPVVGAVIAGAIVLFLAISYLRKK